MVIGGTVYPMAAALCHVLLADQSRLKMSAGPATLELGAGTGAVGIFAAALGARCTLTDKIIARAATQPVSYSAEGDLDVIAGETRVLLDLLERNAHANQESAQHRIQVAPLDFLQPDDISRTLASSPRGDGFALVLGSDITYEQSSHTGIANAIAQLLQPPHDGRAGVALLAHETRRLDAWGADVQLASFVRAAEARGLRVEQSALQHVQEGSAGSLLRLSLCHSP